MEGPRGEVQGRKWPLPFQLRGGVCRERRTASRILLLLPLLLSLGSCSSGKSEEPKARPAVPVKVAAVTQKAIPVQIRTIGSVEPLTTVTVKAQVGGMVTGVYFREGQEVKKGDLLFTIDSRALEAEVRRLESNLSRDQAQVKQAEANLARDLSLLRNAEVEAHRYRELVREGIATQEKLDEAQTNVQALEAAVRADRAALENAQAAVRADRAALENARIQLGYCSIRSPLEGRTGSLQVHVGNVIKANDQPLVTINQIRPIYVSLSVPEQDLPDIRAHMASGQLRVEAAIPGEESRPELGFISFIDNAVDRTTGTIRLKGTFANREARLWPGQFVQVRLTLTVKQDALVVPSQAVQAGQNGNYLFVVKPDLTAEFRPVTVGATFDGETAIEKGVSAGEKVVTEGHIRLTPGARVEIKQEALAPFPLREKGKRLDEARR